MIITFLRSSSIGGWNWCQHKYFLEYTLGWRGESNKKADKGTLVHKVLELLARDKLAKQQGLSRWTEPETGVDVMTGMMTWTSALTASWDYHTKKFAHHTWDAKDRKDCQDWVQIVLKSSEGKFNPSLRDVIQPEQYFDIVIDKPWARFTFQGPDGPVEGQLSIKGTMDLVTRLEPGVIEYIDWKTGKRKDWNKNTDKGFAELREDPQFMLYHYALTKLYPGEQIVMTPFYVTDGGAFTVYFDDEDLKRTEDMLQSYFEQISRCEVPEMIRPSWKCSRLCQFDKDRAASGKTICEHMHDQVVSLGMDRVVKQHGNTSVLTSYGTGGGRSA